MEPLKLNVPVSDADRLAAALDCADQHCLACEVSGA